MAKVTINESTLQALANKIREKTDDSATMTPNQMVGKINTDLFAMELINPTTYETLSPKKNKLYLVPAVSTQEVKDHYQVPNSIDVTVTCDEVASGDFINDYFGVNIDTLTIVTHKAEGDTYTTNILQQLQPGGSTKYLNIRKIIVGSSVQIQPTSFLNLTTVEEMEFYSFPRVTTGDTYLGMFNTCTSLTKVTMHIDTDVYNEFKGHPGLVEIITDDGHRMAVYSNAFENCYNLTHVGGHIRIDKSSGASTLTTYNADTIFKNCYRLTEMPSHGSSLSIRCISNYCYENCYSLKTVDVSAKYLLNYAFHNCKNLQTARLSDFDLFGEHIFEGCTSLYRVEIINNNISYNSYNPANSTQVPVLERQMFKGCTSLTDVVLTNSGIRQLEDYIFDGCTSLVNLTIATRCPHMKLSGRCFSFTNGNGYEVKNTTLQTLNLFNTPTTQFYDGEGGTSSLISGMTNLTNLTLPAYLEIFDISLKGCTSLTSLVIPDSVIKVLGANNFRDCTALTTINWGSSVIDVEPSVANQASSNSYTSYDYSDEEYYGMFVNCPYITEDFTLPTNFNGVASYMFKDCTDLEQLTLGPNALFVGYYGCCGDRALTTVTMSNNLTTLYGYAFYGCTHLSSITLSTSITEIGHSAFKSCIALTTLNLDELTDLTWIGPHAFNGCGLTGITINNDSPLTLSNYCFANCTHLTSCSITGELVPNANTFRGCTSLVTVSLPEITRISDSMFTGCSDLSNSTVTTLLNGVTSVGSYAFSECTSITSLILPNNVTFSSGVFNKCTNLTSIQLPSSMTSIPYNFLSYTGITSIDLTGITSIGSDAFAYCTSITSITIPSSVTSIAYNAFRHTGLTTVTLPSTVELASSSSGIFAGCSQLVTATINATMIVNSGTKYLPSNTFLDCTSLEEVTINSDITYISNNAFSNCSSLTAVHLPSGITSIASNAFNGCTALTDVYFAGTEAQWNSITINSTGNNAIITVQNPNLTIHYGA